MFAITIDSRPIAVPVIRDSVASNPLSSEDLYRLLAENSSDIVYQTNGLLIEWISPSVTGWLGWDPAELTDQPASSILSPNQDLSWVGTNRDLLQAGQTVNQEMLLISRDGVERWFAGRARPMSRQGDPAGGFMVGLHDIHEQVLSRRALIMSERRYRSAMEHAGVGMALLNSELNTMHVNEALCEFLGRSESDLIEADWGLVTHPDDLEAEMELLDRMQRGELDSFRRPQRYAHPDGTMRYGDLTVAAARDDDGVVVLFTKQIIDITEQTTARRRLHELASQDPLTSLSNRTTVLHELQKALSRQLIDGARVGVLFADLDNFKLINESLGHAAGDALLSAVARRLREEVQEDAIVGRFGGDEFLVVIPGPADEESLQHFASRITESLRADFMVLGRRVVMSTSIGAALSRRGSTPASLLQDADVALSEAKRSGKSRWKVFDLSMAEASLARLIVEGELREALDADEFEIYYQPVHRLADGERVGFEALVRWNHPERGILEPASFLAVAEDTRLITRIGRAVLGKVCADIAAHPQLAETFAVNVSAVELGQDEWLGATLDLIADSGIDPGRLILELTETAVMSIRRDLSSDLSRLRDLGVGIHVDDFGTGYSSISLLRDLPVSGLKLDRSFVSSLTETSTGNELSSSGYALAEGLAGLTRAIGLEGIAEGIETPVQAAFLRAMGWTHGQGWLYGKAAPLDSWLD